jgi:uncharacterized repeat protein (TIGR02543 family)
MADGYTTMYDILKNSLVERRERYGTTAISHIVIDGYKFGGYKTFSSFWEKTYPIQPERSQGGVIDNLNSYATFVTFHLKVDFAMMSIDDYRRLYDLMLDRNEFTVTAYNVRTNQPHTCKMYFAPDQMPKLYAVARKLQGQGDKYIEVLGVQDYTIELIGTNASMDKVEIRYYDENDNLIANAVKSVDKGVETIVNYDYTATSGYRFDGQWEKNNDPKAIVNNGEILTPTDNIKLKAKVVPTSQFALLMDYGVGIKPTPQDSIKQVDSFTIQYGTTLGSAISNANITLSDGTKLAFPSSGTGVAEVTYNGKKYSGDKAYEFSGWYWTTEANSGTQVNANTTYKYQLNRTIHQIYTPKSYAINFTTNDTAITLFSITAKYNEKVVVPQLNVSGKTFKGWYWKDGETEVGFNGIMPPFTINLYAKWE